MSLLPEIYEYIKSGESDAEDLGLEIEHFIVDEKGRQISFEEITSLIEGAAKDQGAEITYIDGYPVGFNNGKYSISLEPACQFEISINPYSSLEKIGKIYRGFLSFWEPLLKRKGYRLIYGGNLPIVESGEITPDDIPLSPKKRYQYMDSYFRRTGKFGKYMMRASASTQVSVDYRSEEDLVRKLRILQKISPVFMIIMENKNLEDSHLPGIEDKTHLLRIQEWDDIDPDRTGYFPGSFDEDFGYKKAAEAVFHTPLILLTDRGSTIDVGSKTAEDLEYEGIVSEEGLVGERKKALVEHYLSMGFFHFRIKKYIEIRVADSVPIDRALSYAALIKGIVYSDENLDILDKELQDVDSIDKINEAVRKIEKDGLGAVIYHGKTASEWASYLTGLSRSRLRESEKGFISDV